MAIKFDIVLHMKRIKEYECYAKNQFMQRVSFVYMSKMMKRNDLIYIKLYYKKKWFTFSFKVVTKIQNVAIIFENRLINKVLIEYYIFHNSS